MNNLYSAIIPDNFTDNIFNVYDVIHNSIKDIKSRQNQEIDTIEYKCIMVIGRAINFVTKSDDLQSWLDFSEYIFNQTYFWYKGKKVFPVPFLSEWIKSDNFQRFFVIKQIEKIKKEIKK